MADHDFIANPSYTEVVAHAFLGHLCHLMVLLFMFKAGLDHHSAGNGIIATVEDTNEEDTQKDGVQKEDIQKKDIQREVN